MASATLKRNDLLYPELSYQIVGCAYDVFNELGPGHPESVYEKAMAVAFRKCGIGFQEQAHRTVEFAGERVGNSFLDFIVDETVVLEIKKGNNFSITHMNQVFKYLKATKLKLAIIVCFGSEGVRFKRVPNIKPDSPPSTKPAIR